MVKLGVNIDHVATLRQARRTVEPDPVQAALEAEKAGCDGIVFHLRKDRRHIQDSDIFELKNSVRGNLNMEMSVDPEILAIACELKPHRATIVPENRQEITTEGGLDVAGNLRKISAVVSDLKSGGIGVSLFIDPERRQIEASVSSGAEMVEFHTGAYAEKFLKGEDTAGDVRDLGDLTDFAISKGLTVAAGHGLTYANVSQIAGIKGMYELNIGHSIISRSVFCGLYEAVRNMKELIAV